MEYNKPKDETTAVEKRDPKFNKIISGNVSKKQSVGKSLFSESIADVGIYVVKEVIVPTIKKTICDVITNGISMLVWGDSRGASNRGSSGYFDYTRASGSRISSIAYGDSWKSRDERTSPKLPGPSEGKRYTVYDYQFVTFDTKADAQLTVESMVTILDCEDKVRVSDFYEIIGIKEFDYTCDNYGWDDLGGVECKRSFDGNYYITLPKCKPIR